MIVLNQALKKGKTQWNSFFDYMFLGGQLSTDTNNIGIS